MWQDFVFTAGTVVFAIGLIPSVLGKNKPSAITSVMSGSTLFVFAICYYTLNLLFTAVLTFAISLMWFTLAYQVIRRKK